ncbi:hypothetical protein PSPO01_01899 [Paraphaeosphaeria sporulosa]
MDPELSNVIDEPMQDVVRTTAANLILDVQQGVLDGMTESQHPEQRGKHPAFGEGILALAREIIKLKDSTGEGCEECEGGRLYEDMEQNEGVRTGVKEYAKEHPQCADQVMPKEMRDAGLDSVLFA